MSLSIVKKIKYIVVIFLLFLVNVPCVKAEEQNDELYQICNNNTGYFYLVKVTDKNNKIDAGSFYTMSADKKTATTISGFLPASGKNVTEGYMNTITLPDGTIATYALGGSYNRYNDSRNTTRCYTTITTEGDAQDGKATIVPHYCGEGGLIAVGDADASDDTAENNDSGDILIENSGPDDNGLTKITIKANSKYLKDNWKDVVVTTIRYSGAGSDYQKTLINKVERVGTSFVIEGVKPVIVKTDSDGDVVEGYGSGTFIISLAIKNNDSTRINVGATVAACGEWFYLGDFSTTIVDSASLKVKNTYKNSETCKNVKNFSTASENFKKNYIYECYNDKLNYSEITNISSTVESKYNTLLSIYGGLNVASGGLAYSEDLLCTSSDFGLPSDKDTTTVPFERKVTYEYSGNYWGMVCIQDYYIESDNPQLVKGGMGVHYNNRVEINKNCYIYNKNVVQKKPQCVLSVSEPVCVDPGGVTWSDMTTGGPVEDFDSCVKSCDNGQYSQSCINQCYKKVYSSDRKLSLSNSKNNDSFINKITKVEKEANCGFNSYSGNDSCGDGISISCDPNSYCAANGKNGTCFVRDEEGNNLQTVCYSAWCNNHNGTSTECSVSWNVGPSDCSWDPDGDYYGEDGELAKSKAELEDLQTLMKDKSHIENYSIEFTDSVDNVIYKVSGNSREDKTNAPDQPRLVISEDSEKTGIINSTENRFTYGSEGDSILTNDMISHRTVYDIKLPIQYSLKTDSNTIIVGGTKDDSYFIFNDNKGNIEQDKDNAKFYYKFIKKDIDDKKLLSDGEHVYYTSLDSAQLNLKTYTSEKTTTTCGVSIKELVKSSPVLDLESQKVVDQIQQSPDGVGYYLFTNRDYIFYEINDVQILKVLEARDKNIGVSFTMESLGSTKSLSGLSNLKSDGIKVSEFKDSGYSCYYGVINFIKGDLSDDMDNVEEFLNCEGDQDPDPTPTPTNGGKPGSQGLRYYYREIYLNGENKAAGVVGGMFPNGRKPRWNWTGTIGADGTVTGAANKDDLNYVVDPEKLIADIEKKGDSVFGDESEYDYVFTMTPDIINEIRTYNNNKDITYLDFSLVGASTDKKTYSKMISEWFDNLSPSVLVGISDCNNVKNGKCD